MQDSKPLGDNKPRLLVTSGTLSGHRELLAALETDFGVDYSPQKMPASIAPYQIVIIGNEWLPSELLAAAKELRLICRFGVHTHRIDWETVKRMGICVTNCPNAGSSAVSEYVVGSLLYLLRHLPRLRDAKGHDVSSLVGDDLGAKIFGIVGLGSVGSNLARKVAGLGCKVVGYNRTPRRLNELNIEWLDLDDVFRISDIVSINVGGAPATYHIADGRRLGSMKPGSYLVNTAWPDAVDVHAVRELLLNGHLAGAVIDYDYADTPMNDVPGVFQTPHIAAKAWSATTEKAVMIQKTIAEFQAGRRLTWQVVESQA